MIRLIKPFVTFEDAKEDFQYIDAETNGVQHS
jgi:hypothetical protein